MSAPDKTLPRVVGLGELHVGTGSGELSCLGLGSCICICLYDSVTRVTGMAHVVLPSAPDGPVAGPGKFADTAVPALIDLMEGLGAQRRRMKARLAGGARMTLTRGVADVFAIGEKNVQAVREHLAAARIPVVNEDIGGSRGRSVRMDVLTGRVEVNFAGEAPRDL